jgi:hypothetical protein
MRPTLLVATLIFFGCSAEPLDIPSGPATPGTAVPSSAPPACSTLDAAACGLRSDCEAASCKSCGKTVYSCLDAGAPAPSCPVTKCSCGEFTDEASCNQVEGCIAVYVSPACQCAGIGCCMHFDHCAETVQCAPDATPLCPPPPECKAGYTNVYDGGCAVGCVTADVCMPPGD